MPEEARNKETTKHISTLQTLLFYINLRENNMAAPVSEV